MPNPFIEQVNQFLSEPQASLLNGMLFGMRTSIPKTLYEALIITGTIHIVALSGQNITILVRIFSEATLFLGRKVSLLLTIVGIGLFLALVGLEPTIVRASIMGTLTLLAVYFGKQSWSLLSLILAAGIMLIINPGWVYELSFQLSFMATLGIILLVKVSQSKPKNWWQEIRREVEISLKTTLAAQLFTVPIIFINFQRISLIAPLTNVLISWTIGPIMLLGLLVSAIGFLVPVTGQIIAWAVWVPLTYIIKIVEITAGIPFASVSF